MTFVANDVKLHLFNIPIMSDDDETVSSGDKGLHYDSEADDEDEFTKNFEQSSRQFQQTIYEYWATDDDNDPLQPRRKRRKLTREPKGVVCYTDENGVRKVLPPTMSL